MKKLLRKQQRNELEKEENTEKWFDESFLKERNKKRMDYMSNPLGEKRAQASCNENIKTKKEAIPTTN